MVLPTLPKRQLKLDYLKSNRSLRPSTKRFLYYMIAHIFVSVNILYRPHENVDRDLQRPLSTVGPRPGVIAAPV